MNLPNPFNLLDSLLADYASPKIRRLVHTLLLLGLVIALAILSFDGDWDKALIAAAVAVYAALNKANTPATKIEPAGHNPDYSDDGLSYEQAGGNSFPE